MKTKCKQKGENFQAEDFDAGQDKFQLRIKKELFLRGDEHAETANEFVAVDFNAVQSVIEDPLMTKQVCQQTYSSAYCHLLSIAISTSTSFMTLLHIRYCPDLRAFR